jgi:hypothetical protein
LWNFSNASWPIEDYQNVSWIRKPGICYWPTCFQFFPLKGQVHSFSSKSLTNTKLNNHSCVILFYFFLRQLLPTQSKLASSLWSSCLHLMSTGTVGIPHPALTAPVCLSVILIGKSCVPWKKERVYLVSLAHKCFSLRQTIVHLYTAKILRAFFQFFIQKIKMYYCNNYLIKIILYFSIKTVLLYFFASELWQRIQLLSVQGLVPLLWFVWRPSSFTYHCFYATSAKVSTVRKIINHTSCYSKTTLNFAEL